MAWPATRAKWIPAAAPHPPRRWPSSLNVTDAVWLKSGRLVLAINGFGVVLSDDVGETLYQVPTMDRSTLTIGGRISLAAVDDKRVYVLYTNRWNGRGLVRQIADATLDVTKPAPVAAAQVSGMPVIFSKGQGDYDQCIAVDRAPVAAAADLDGTNDGLVDRLYLGGDALLPTGGNDFCAELWIMDMKAGRQLGPAPRDLHHRSTTQRSRRHRPRIGGQQRALRRPRHPTGRLRKQPNRVGRLRRRRLRLNARRPCSHVRSARQWAGHARAWLPRHTSDHAAVRSPPACRTTACWCGSATLSGRSSSRAMGAALRSIPTRQMS